MRAHHRKDTFVTARNPSNNSSDGTGTTSPPLSTARPESLFEVEIHTANRGQDKTGVSSGGLLKLPAAAQTSLALQRQERARLRRRVLAVLSLAVVLGLLIVEAVALWQPRLKSSTGDATLRTGTQAPDFSMRGLDGKEVKLSLLRGKIVVLNMWAPWCPLCRAQMPVLEAMYKAQGSSSAASFELIGVAIQSEPSNVSAFAKEFGITFPIVVDTQNAVTELYRVGPIPTTYFIGKDTTIRYRQVGWLDATTFQQGIDAATR